MNRFIVVLSSTFVGLLLLGAPRVSAQAILITGASADHSSICVQDDVVVSAPPAPGSDPSIVIGGTLGSASVLSWSDVGHYEVPVIARVGEQTQVATVPVDVVDCPPRDVTVT